MQAREERQLNTAGPDNPGPELTKTHMRAGWRSVQSSAVCPFSGRDQRMQTMRDYPYIRANAKRRNWRPLTLIMVLNQARLEQAPADAYTYFPGDQNNWPTVGELAKEASAGCQTSKSVLAGLEACL
jgi:hypothetical protein